MLLEIVQIALESTCVAGLRSATLLIREKRLQQKLFSAKALRATFSTE